MTDQDLVARLRATARALREEARMDGPGARDLDTAADRIEALSAENTRLTEVLDWIGKQIHRGEGTVVFGLTDDGDIGLWLHNARYPTCLAAGDSIDDAVAAALARLDAAREPR